MTSLYEFCTQGTKWLKVCGFGEYTKPSSVIDLGHSKGFFFWCVAKKSSLNELRDVFEHDLEPSLIFFRISSLWVSGDGWMTSSKWASERANNESAQRRTNRAKSEVAYSMITYHIIELYGYRTSRKCLTLCQRKFRRFLAPIMTLSMRT